MSAATAARYGLQGAIDTVGRIRTLGNLPERGIRTGHNRPAPYTTPATAATTTPGNNRLPILPPLIPPGNQTTRQCNGNLHRRAVVPNTPALAFGRELMLQEVRLLMVGTPPAHGNGNSVGDPKTAPCVRSRTPRAHRLQQPSPGHTCATLKPAKHGASGGCLLVWGLTPAIPPLTRAGVIQAAQANATLRRSTRHIRQQGSPMPYPSNQPHAGKEEYRTLNWTSRQIEHRAGRASSEPGTPYQPARSRAASARRGSPPSSFRITMSVPLWYR